LDNSGHVDASGFKFLLNRQAPLLSLSQSVINLFGRRGRSARGVSTETSLAMVAKSTTNVVEISLIFRLVKILLLKRIRNEVPAALITGSFPFGTIGAPTCFGSIWANQSVSPAG
jgi:hypothetical protein